MDQEQEPSTAFCPRCRAVGETRRLVYIYYMRDRAFFSCEDRNCTYFVTDRRGKPAKFKFDKTLKRVLPMKTVPVFEDYRPAEYEKRIPSLSEDYVVSQNTEASFSSSIIMNSNNVVQNDSQTYIVSQNTATSSSLPSITDMSEALQDECISFYDSYECKDDSDLPFWKEILGEGYSRPSDVE